MREVNFISKVNVSDSDLLNEIDARLRVPFVVAQDVYEENNEGIFMVKEDTDEIIVFKDKTEYKLSVINNQVKFVKQKGG